jgi:N-acetylglucosaminyl-diphospho-decaprenol L-rhamnosyltransferase
VVDLSVVIVSWNVKELLERCLVSLRVCRSPRGAKTQRGREPECEIIVVDSASSDGSPGMVRQQFPHVRLIASDANLGFVKANNRGISASTGRYLLLLNPDTEVVGADLTSMVAYMDAHPGVGVLGPKLVFADGRVQLSRRRFPTLTTAFLESTVLQQWFPHHRALQNYYVEDKSDSEEQDIDWLVGACLLIRRTAWEGVGPLDENIFMYSEELDWCRRAKAAGWRVVYVPWATVVHHEGQSSSQVVSARHSYFQSSKVYYFRKYHGAVVGEALRCFLLATYLFQLALEAAKWLVGHKRALRRERMAAYIRVLRSGLRTPGRAAGRLVPTGQASQPERGDNEAR